MKKSLKQLRHLLDSKQVSAVELTQECLKRINDNPNSNAYITVTEDEALSNAKAAQEIIDSGEAKPLTGIPAAVKDNICTSGIKTTCGSKMLEEFTPFYDARVITQLKKQNYVLLGKTNMDEFAMGNSNRTSYFGSVPNPHDGERVAGGSSGGSASAVVSGACAYALGTDTRGSIRQPAAHCGITGLKPTYDLISRQGVAAFSGSLDTVGFLTNSAEDCAFLISALAYVCGTMWDALSDMKGIKIAVVKEFFPDDLDSSVKQAVMNTVTELEKAGAVVVETSVPTLEYAAAASFVISSAEGVTAMSRYDGVKYGLRGEGYTYDEQIRDSRTRGFGMEVKRRLMLGNYTLIGENYNEFFRKSLAIKQQLCREFDEVLDNADVIISPTTASTAFKTDEVINPAKLYSSAMYSVPANMTGLPCVSSPCNKAGMPVGVSVTGRKFDELRILQIADYIEKAVSV
ncbi:MAG: aspartyl/glutamyl-tRNA amidotransferase subunit A [Oscillospiraceae bacterium]|nr:aspartyl/glutamyl-tRNA amidotransferase subunit A [Oscillospiraceae bacterium]